MIFAATDESSPSIRDAARFSGASSTSVAAASGVISDTTWSRSSVSRCETWRRASWVGIDSTISVSRSPSALSSASPRASLMSSLQGLCHHCYHLISFIGVFPGICVSTLPLCSEPSRTGKMTHFVDKRPVSFLIIFGLVVLRNGYIYRPIDCQGVRCPTLSVTCPESTPLSSDSVLASSSAGTFRPMARSMSAKDNRPSTCKVLASILLIVASAMSVSVSSWIFQAITSSRFSETGNGSTPDV